MSKNSVSFMITTYDSVEPVELSQKDHTTIHGVFGGTGYFGGETTHDIIDITAAKDGTTFKGRSKYFFIPENVQGMISPTSIWIDIAGYKRIGGSIKLEDSAAIIKFMIACGFDEI
jgi:hypothetical protein